MTSICLPRFPQPFVERLSLYCKWKEVLALLSIDKREQIMRAFWINYYSKLCIWGETPTYKQAQALIKKYPNCFVYQHLTNRSAQKLVKQVSRLYYDTPQSTEELSQCMKLTELEFSGLSTWRVSSRHLPPSLKSLTFGSNYFHSLAQLEWPKYLQTLVITSTSIDSVQFAQVCLPESLARLSVNVCLPNKPGFLPSNLESLLCIGFGTLVVTKNYWPGKLQCLGLKELPQLNVELPDSLFTLHLEDIYRIGNLNFVNVRWPSNLNQLSFYFPNVTSVDGLQNNFPNSVIRMRFGRRTYEFVSCPFVVFDLDEDLSQVPIEFHDLINANRQSIGEQERRKKRQRIKEPSNASL